MTDQEAHTLSLDTGARKRGSLTQCIARFTKTMTVTALIPDRDKFKYLRWINGGAGNCAGRRSRRATV